MELGRRRRPRAGAPCNRSGDFGEQFDHVAVLIRIAICRSSIVFDVRRAQTEKLAVGMNRSFQVVVRMSDGAMMNPLEVLQAGAKQHQQPTQTLQNLKNGSDESCVRHGWRADLSARIGVCKKRLAVGVAGLQSSRLRVDLKGAAGADLLAGNGWLRELVEEFREEEIPADRGGGGVVAFAGGGRYAASMETVLVQCPTCFESFEVVMPPAEELPAEMDYDCEVCCRPMILLFDDSGGFARGMGE